MSSRTLNGIVRQNGLQQLPGFGSYDGGEFVEHSAAEDLAFDREPALPGIVEEYSFQSEFLPEYVILGQEIFNGVLLLAIDPAGENQEQQVPWLNHYRLKPVGPLSTESRRRG